MKNICLFVAFLLLFSCQSGEGGLKNGMPSLDLSAEKSTGD